MEEEENIEQLDIEKLAEIALEDESQGFGDPDQIINNLEVEGASE